MRRFRFLLLVLLALLISQLLLPGSRNTQAAPAEIKSERWVQTSVEEWRAGASEGLLISNNDGGEIRLDQGARHGVLLGPPYQASFSFTALTVAWIADIPARTSVTIEVRTSADGETWSDWQELAGGRLATPIAIENGAQWAQYRLTLESLQLPASPVVSELVFTFFDTTQGPTLRDRPPQQPIIGGKLTLTPRPRAITREGWGALPQKLATIARPERVVISVLPASGDPLAYLRLLQSTTISNTLPYAFFVEPGGAIIQGRAGIADEEGTVGLAFLGEPTDESFDAMAGLVAWINEAYALQLSATAVDQSGSAELQDALREAVDRATVRSRWLFPEGNTRDYTDRLMFYNPGSVEAQARLISYPPSGEPFTYAYTVAPGGYFDLVLNDILSDTVDLPVEVVSSQPLVAEQTMLFVNDALNAPGISTPARSWYFAEGAGDPGTQTYLLLFNPHDEEVAAEVLLMSDRGRTATQRLTIEPHSRYVLRASDVMTDTFGAKVIASRPIAAARTMRFSEVGGHLSNGAPAPSHSWYFAEGTSEQPITTTLALLNPNPERANATLTIFTGDGTALSRSYALPGMTRLTINLRDLAPGLGLASAITADRPIVAERTMLFGAGRAGTSTIGAPRTAYVWRFAEGRTAAPATEYLIIANPNDRPARIRLVFDTQAGPITQSLSLPRRARIVLPVDDSVIDQRHTTTVYSSLPVVAERTILISNEEGLSGHTSLGIPER
ncbi:MAG: N-acetylmuramoyl-L-alanine amidase [Herpetosiphonaceae bacterium]|nr:MAG: N-acetylmuramoyl-L-alanine amidase [Herpetosiphonaceae bacterium]